LILLPQLLPIDVGSIDRGRVAGDESLYVRVYRRLLPLLLLLPAPPEAEVDVMDPHHPSVDMR